LAVKLRHTLQEKGLGNQVVVQHFHGWCKQILEQYGIPKPRWQDYEGDGFIRALENEVLQSVASGKIPQGIYGAVLIDEAHDFEATWLELLAKMPHPNKSHLLILHDDAQNLYSDRQRPVWSHIGIQARGRTHILTVNYRNTHEVATWAHQFARDMFIETAEIDEDIPQIVVPEMSGRSGVLPKLKCKSGFQAELNYIAQGIKRLHENGRPWCEIAILYAFERSGKAISDTLSKQGIPISWLKGQQERHNFNPEHPSVKVMPIKSSKGLEFPVVCIPGIDKMEQYNERVQVLYVGMTRSTDKLVLTYTDQYQDSMLVKKLQAALPETAQVLDFPAEQQPISA
jgi:superfamily I DNA/RNA helicase